MSDENTQNEENIMQDYELGFHLIPTLDDKTEAAFADVTSAIEKAGGIITADSKPVMIPLAYTMVKKIDSKNFKYDTASFAWIKFTAATASIEELKEVLDLNDSILRYILLKSDAAKATPTESVASFLQGDEEDDEEKDSNTEEKESVTEHEDKGEDIEETKEEESESTEKEINEETDIDKKVDEAIDAITDTEEK